MTKNLEFQKLIKAIRTRNIENTIIIYQMGKVGSQSLKESIIRDGFDCLNLYSLKVPTLNLVSKNINYKNKKFVFLGSIRQKLYSLILRSAKVKKKIITVVRDPIARDVSFIYHFFSVFLYNLINQGTGEEFSLQELIQNIYDKYIIHGSATNWFNNDFNKTLGLNIFDYPFNKDKGCSFIKYMNFNILILTLEKLNNNEKIIGDFLGSKDFKLISTNRATKKWYSEIYRLTKDSIFISEEQIERIYSSNFMKHFYNNNDILEFKNKWLKENSK
jgi:hypothetical protein